MPSSSGRISPGRPARGLSATITSEPWAGRGSSLPGRNCNRRSVKAKQERASTSKHQPLPFFNRVERRAECLLYRILSVGLVAEKPARRAQQASAVASDDGLEPRSDRGGDGRTGGRGGRRTSRGQTGAASMRIKAMRQL